MQYLGKLTYQKGKRVNWQKLIPDCPPYLAAAADAALADVAPAWAAAEAVALTNQARVLAAFHAAGVGEHHLGGTTGYGLDDTGRDKLEEVYARSFGAEAALVRLQISSGTHAIALGLFGSLRPGDELLAAAGTPYDSLQPVIAGAPGSLADWGVTYREVPLGPGGQVDPAAVAAAVGPQTRTVLIQRSRGYSLRPSLSVTRIADLIAAVRAVRPAAVCLVDNCYGEFVEELEPAMVGADLVCGSLIKNPGGGLAPTGGYVAGRADLVERAAARLTAPGVGGDIGPTLGLSRLLFQGFYLAPHVVGEALKGALFTAALFARLGFSVRPGHAEPRTDLIQAVELGSAEALIAFCQAVQRAGAVDAHLHPVPERMPGYADPVVMAAGGFVQGASIELSADGPLRPPFAAYFQGGLTHQHVIWAALKAAAELAGRGLLPAPA